MQKVKQYFQELGFAGDELEKIVNAFTLQVFKKNDFVVQEGKTSKHIWF